MSRTRSLLTVLALALAAATAPAATAGAAAPSAGTLYVQQATGGSLQRGAHGWRLVLRGAAPRLTTFSDRPVRLGGSQPLRGFVAGWKSSFGDVAPNAALEIADAPVSRDVVLLELGRPRLARRTVSYRVTPLTTSSATRLAALARRADRARSDGLSFGRASLFIDDGSTQISYALSFDATNIDRWSVNFDNATLGESQLTYSSEGAVLTILPNAITGQAAPLNPFAGGVQGTMSVPASGQVTGAADLPPGITANLQIGNGNAVALSPGAFSIPVPGPPTS